MCFLLGFFRIAQTLPYTTLSSEIRQLISPRAVGPELSMTTFLALYSPRYHFSIKSSTFIIRYSIQLSKWNFQLFLIMKRWFYWNLQPNDLTFLIKIKKPNRKKLAEIRDDLCLLISPKALTKLRENNLKIFNSRKPENPSSGRASRGCIT